MSGPAETGAGPRGTEWLTPDDPRLGWDGLVELERLSGGWLPRRIPAERLATTLSPNFSRLAAMPAGIRCGVRTDAEELVLRLSVEASDAPLDVVVDGSLALRTAVDGEREITVPLAPGPAERPAATAPRDVEVWLPHLGRVLVSEIGFRGHGTVRPADRPGLRWVAYGSSITQSMFPSGPSRTWTALIAAEHGWRLHNLGFSGEAHLDPVVARTIRDRPADLVSLELGINVHTRDTYSERSWAPAVCGFVDTIRDGHPDVPIAVITPLSSPEREDSANRVGLTLAQLRAQTEEAVRVLERLGDKNLHTVDGLGIAPVHEADGIFADGLHPTADGEHVLAARIGTALRKAVTPAGL
ncbi:GDSL-type esterase/lipase family protein [Streptomyces cinerochromogenes]|uniref:GDSL-type esterase/lipase family protein n=1 Tax=Streptomyces cinerochromogenes TaxID=66422 RepID=UPI0036A1EA87